MMFLAGDENQLDLSDWSLSNIVFLDDPETARMVLVDWHDHVPRLEMTARERMARAICEK